MARSRGCRRSVAGCAGGDFHGQVASGYSLGPGQAVRVSVYPGGGLDQQDVLAGGGLGDGAPGGGGGAAGGDLPAQPPGVAVSDQLGGPEGDLRVVAHVQESGRLDVLVTLRIAGGEAGGVDHRRHGRGRDRVGDGDLTRDQAEGALHRGKAEHVPGSEGDCRGGRVELVESGRWYLDGCARSRIDHYAVYTPPG